MTQSDSVIKIAQVIGNTVTGGVPSCVLNYFRFVDKVKFRFDFYTYGPSRLDEEIKRLGGNIFYIPKVSSLPKFIWTLTKLFKNHNYDIIHSHMTTLSVFPLFAGWLAGVKTRFCHAHSTTHKKEKVRIVKNLLKRLCKIFSTKNIACSNYCAAWMYGKNAKAITILRNAIDTSKFSPNAMKGEDMKRKWQADSFVVGHIGRFEYQKNHEFLLRIMREVINDEPEAKLVLVGQGSLKDKIMQQIEELNILDNVIFEPEIQEVEDYYSGFDIFVLPSRYEGLPLVGVEAQAMGLPCMFSKDITQEADITKNNYYLAAENPSEWAKKIIEVIKNKEVVDYSKVKKLGYDIKETVSDLEKLYTNAL